MADEKKHTVGGEPSWVDCEDEPQALTSVTAPSDPSTIPSESTEKTTEKTTEKGRLAVPSGSRSVERSGSSTRSVSPREDPRTNASVLEFRVITQHGRMQAMDRALEEAKADSEAPIDTISLSNVETNLGLLDEHWKAFRVTHERITESCTPDFLSKPYVVCGAYDMAFKSYSAAKRILSELKAKLIRQTTPDNLTSQGSLPRIPLPTFSGQYSDWKSFSDLFLSLVGNREDISQVEKLVRLKSALKDEAAGLLSNITVAEENYAPAWRTLTERYENRRLLASSQLNRLLGLTPLNRKSAQGLLALVSTTKEVLDALKALELPVEHWDCIVVHVLTRILDPNTREAWEVRLGSRLEVPSLTEFLEFIAARARALENFERETASSKGPANAPKRASYTHTASTSGQGDNDKSQSTSEKYTCSCCNGKHYITTCARFLSMVPADRRGLVEKSRLCYNCLGPHGANSCRSAKRCQKCEGKHHTLIHQGSPGDRSRQVSTHSAAEPSTQPSNTDVQEEVLKVTVNFPPPRQSHSSSRTYNPGQRANIEKAVAQPPLNSEDLPQAVLLATARATAFNDNQGISKAVRILIDPGSELSFISERVVNDLRLPRKSVNVSIFGIGGFNTGSTRGVVSLRIQSLFSDDSVTFYAYILKRLTTTLPSFLSETIQRDLFKNLQLSDSSYSYQGPIDAIIGADTYGKIIEPQIVKSDTHGLIAQRTKLGWVISGPVDTTARHERASHSAVRSGGSEDEDLSQILQRYWIQEEIPSTAGAEINPDDLICEKHFKDTHSRESTGRYIVRLPFKESPSLLGESKPTALRCLRRVAKRLSTDASYRQLYTEFIKEYESLGHMEAVSDHSEPSAAVYLPHLGVLKEDRVTTKLRVVFNGSSRTSSGVSVNEILHAGGKLQIDAPDVLIWLRRPRWIFGTDIVKMFRQIKVHQDDWDFQRILWFNEEDNLVTYRLTTVTYGMTCAPWLSLRVLQQLTEDEGHRFPLAVPSLTQGRYVDDIFGGSDTRHGIKAVILDLIGICNAGGFPLQKWNSNCPEVLNELDLQSNPDNTIQFDDTAVSVLGMCWHPTSDTLRFKAKVFVSTTFTKRSVLSEISQIYDPLGFISPVIIRAKILIQELWLLKVGWDDPLPSDVVARWLEFRKDLGQLDNISIPRWLQISPSDTVFQLHGFSDASTLAMSAVVYLRTEHQGHPTTVSLLCAKTKVAPIKKPVIARLELTAALMLSKLMAYAKSMLGIETIQLYCWTDSSVTLAWVTSHPSRWKEFVRNRVSKIQENIPQGQWRHVSGIDNPADCASRGISPSDLESHPLWWAGPTWLIERPALWSRSSGDVTADEAPEALPDANRLTTLSAHTIKASTWHLLERYSRLSKLLQITASVRRAIRRLRRQEIYDTSVLDTRELEEARIFWIKTIQQQYFGLVIKSLLTGLNVPHSDPLSRLTPFVDNQGILRLGGRLKFSNLSEEGKQPAILPRSSIFTDLIVKDAHMRTLYGGTQLTLSCIRERY